MKAQDELQNYGYNTRDELISGQGLTYNYDDIGNRTTAEGKTYTANELNQYTAIDSFTPQYDVDGNQTLIQTSTGIWSVTYNAENRPVSWESGDTVVTMDFDRMGRRVFYKEEVNGVVTKYHRFVYDNYLCVQKVDALNNNSQINLFVWDPTEPVATRPLFTQRGTGYKFFYTCDGNKNVSEMVHFEQRNGIAAHYDYAPFGAVTRSVSASAITDNTFTIDNPFRFSSEYHDDTLGLVYYNYRHYNPTDGRWCGRDLIEISPSRVYTMCGNNIIFITDELGLYTIKETLFMYLNDSKTSIPLRAYLLNLEDPLTSIYLFYLLELGEQRLFDIWVEYEKKDMSWLEKLPKCPQKISVSPPLSPGADWATPTPREAMYRPEIYHPDAAFELRTVHATADGAGNQCIYDKEGCLIATGVSAGTADRRQAPKRSDLIELIFTFLTETGHQGEDVVPFDWAYRLDGYTHGPNVDKYILVRPSIFHKE